MTLHPQCDKRISSRWTRIVFIGILMGVVPLLATDRPDCYWDYTFTHYHRYPDGNGFDGRQRSINGTFMEPYDAKNDYDGYVPIIQAFENFFGRPWLSPFGSGYPFVARLLKPEHSLQKNHDDERLKTHEDKRLNSIMSRAPTQETLNMLDARGHRVLTLETDLGFYAITIIQVPIGDVKTSLSVSEGQKLLDEKLSAFDVFNVFTHAYGELMEAEARTGNDSSVYLSTVDPDRRVVPSHEIWMPYWPSDTVVDPAVLDVPEPLKASSPPTELGAKEFIQHECRATDGHSNRTGYLLILSLVLGISAVAMAVISSMRKDRKSVKKLRSLDQSLEEAPRTTKVGTVSDGGCCEESV